VRRLIRRTAALGLSVTLILGASAAPCTAQTVAAGADGKLTRLSPASRAVLVSPSVSPKPRSGGGSGGKLRTSKDGQTTTPATSESFFKSTRGKVTLALMGAGTILTLWSIQHDRKPVKSPVR
jgi:hypothetical protein